MGIPDMYAGRSLGKLHAFNASISFPAGMDTYIFQLPFPGVAYWVVSVPNGTLITGNVVPVEYSDAASMGFGAFAPGPGTGVPYVTSSLQVGSFRSVSLAMEIQPTTNEMTWTGNISSAKFPVRLVPGIGVRAAAAEDWVLNGINALQVALLSGYSGNLYTASFNHGLYSCSLNRASTFEFHDMLSVPYDTLAPSNPVTFATDSSSTFQLPPNHAGTTNSNAGYITGVDDLDTIVARISVPPGTNAMTAIIKTWHCVEYVPAPGSTIYEYSHISPPYDQLALVTYKEVAAQLPVAVSCYENANFWQRVLGLAARSLSAARSIPGVVGAVASGATTLMKGFEAMGLN